MNTAKYVEERNFNAFKEEFKGIPLEMICGFVNGAAHNFDLECYAAYYSWQLDDYIQDNFSVMDALALGQKSKRFDKWASHHFLDLVQLDEVVSYNDEDKMAEEILCFIFDACIIGDIRCDWVDEYGAWLIREYISKQ